MIIDTSVVIAIILHEAEREQFLKSIALAEELRMSVANLLEATMVLESRGGETATRELDQFLERSGVELIPVSVEQIQAARGAWRRFGKGNHPAALNFGDCFAYALAETMRAPLLFKGEDFAQTDTERA